MTADGAIMWLMTILKASTVHSHGSVRYLLTNVHSSLKLEIEMICDELKLLLSQPTRKQGTVITAAAAADGLHSPNRSC
jgi:hypothetical protein